MDIKIIATIINIAHLLLTNCNNRINGTHHLKLDDFYKKNQQQKLTINNSIKNILFIEKLDSQCKDIECEQQIMIERINYYFKSKNTQLALDTIDQFLTLYPNHSKTDFMLYTKGLINSFKDNNKNNILKLFNNNNLSKHNPIYAYAALENFFDLTKKYPNSKYYEESKKKIFYLQNRIAEYNLNIAKFYFKKKAYTATINRIQQILHDFPNTAAAYQALPYLKKAHKYLDNLTKN